MTLGRAAPPEELDGYRIVRPLGAGAMGVVYLAHDTLLDRDVALKVIASLDPGALDRERFVREARAIARLQHPNVVAVFRVGEAQGVPYLVSELVRGESLEKLHKPVAQRELLAIGVGIARGLAAAHKRGVLHRDIKPANVLLTEDGVVKLCDFGLAKITHDATAPASAPAADADADARPPRDALPQGADGAATLSFHGARPVEIARGAAPRGSVAIDVGMTEPGALLGTPRYMAPEAWRGAPSTVASDVYSLGALLYELASGQPPHAESTLDALRDAACTRDAAPLHDVAPGHDEALARAIDRCLRREPSARFASADELADALAQVEARPRKAPPGSPYRGLSAFDEAHRALFFGRDDDVSAIVARLRAEPAVVVTGDSGVGKSSVCLAGVLPAVAEGALDDGRSWGALKLVPGKRPFDALLTALAPRLGAATSPSPGPGPSPARAPGDALASLAAREPLSLVRELRRAEGERGLLVFVDQLEELFTLAEPDQASKFAAVLATLADHVPGVRVLGTVRGDFLTRVVGLTTLGAVASRALYLLGPLSHAALREAVEEPARAAGLAFDGEETVDALATAAMEPGALPLLQFALAELWERRDARRGLLLASTLEASGGVAGALARHADGVLARLPPGERPIARRILTRLVSPHGTRARRAEGEIIAPGDPREVRVLTELVSARLVTARANADVSIETATETETASSGDDVAYEVSHEALITKWSTLARWLVDDGGRRAAAERVGRAASEWTRLAEARDALWGPRQLAEVQATGLEPSDLSAGEARFLRASQRAVARRTWARRALLAAVPALIAATYGGFTWSARRALDRAVARHTVVARARIEEARALEGEVTAARATAFAAFDGRDAAGGEAAWSSARALESALDTALASAARELEAALSLDPRRRDERAQLASLLFERAVAAERDGRAQQAAEYIDRLSSYDDGADLARQWTAPAHVTLASTPPGAAVTVATFRDDAGVRRLAPPRDLGTTPLRDVVLPPGSYLFTLHVAGRLPVRYPVLAERGDHVALDVRLPARAPARAGETFVSIPRGRFLFGCGDEEVLRKNVLGAPPRHAIETPAYVIAQTETTFAQWIEYLRALPPPERAARRPSGHGYNGTVSLDEEAGVFTLTLTSAGQTLKAREGERVAYPGRALRREADWTRFPVTGISWDDARAYVRWLDTTARVPGARLCTEHEWERAARGADGRRFPSGDVLRPSDANIDTTYARNPLGMGPDEVGSFPDAASPFGVLDMAGNAWEWTRSVASDDEVVYRGGGWYESTTSSRSDNRQVGEKTMRDLLVSLRVCADADPFE